MQNPPVTYEFTQNHTFLVWTSAGALAGLMPNAENPGDSLACDNMPHREAKRAKFILR